jgi:hypothetical protein
MDLKFFDREYISNRAGLGTLIICLDNTLAAASGHQAWDCGSARNRLAYPLQPTPVTAPAAS